MTKHANLALFSAIAVALSSLSQPAMAETIPSNPADAGVEHPSTTAQVRLASWWFARHAEKIAEIEAANDPKKDKKIELLMVGDSITNNFDKEEALVRSLSGRNTSPRSRPSTWDSAVIGPTMFCGGSITSPSSRPLPWRPRS